MRLHRGIGHAGLALLAMAASLPVAGDALAASKIEVTRFHAPDVPQSGGIAVEPQPGPPDDSLEYRTFASAVGQALAQMGFTDETGLETFRASPYVALIAYDREVRSPNVVPQRRSSVSVGMGGSTGGYHSGLGMGLGIGINLSGKPKDIVFTTLSVQIRRRSDNQAVWEGRAQTSAKVGSQESQAGETAPRLAAALFRDFPGKSGETIKVK